MTKYIARRIIYLFIIMFGISILTFSLTSLLPSDPITMQYVSMGVQVDKEIIEKKKEEMGLNDPFLTQYARWVKNICHGDFGYSIRFSMPVKDKLSIHIANTMKLTLAAVIITIVVSLPLGILSAIYQNRWVDYLIRFISFIGVSMPAFWLGMLLIYYFSIKHKILPTMGMKGMKYIILPSVTLSVWFIAIYIRRIRTSILEEMNKNYVVGLLAKGINEWQILLKHVLPNSLLPIITSFGMSVGTMMGGTIVIETIFEWQGVGRIVMEAITNRDYALVQGYVLWMAFIFVLINLLVDISYHYINPKIRLGS